MTDNPTGPDPIWVLMPFVNNAPMTLQAVEDCLAQTVPTRILLLGQGADKDTREAIDNYIDRREDARVRAVHYLPALPALSMVWNRALDMVWGLGGEVALVVNNDVRLVPWTVEHLWAIQQGTDALFVSAVGVREAQFNTYLATAHPEDFLDTKTPNKGGPDFSCFLISPEAHARYPFDEGFRPCYCEDLDAHRRYMLGGDGARIFSVNLPYLHYASGTLKSYTPEQRAAFDRQFAAVRDYYARKWGGPVNEETFRAPFGKGEYSPWLTAALLDSTLGDNTLTTTPELQRYCQIAAVNLG